MRQSPLVVAAFFNIFLNHHVLPMLLLLILIQDNLTTGI